MPEQFYTEDAVTFSQQNPELNITEAAKAYCESVGISYGEKYRHRLSRALEKLRGNVTPDMSNDKILPAVIDGKLLSIEEYCDYYGIDIRTVAKHNLVSHTGSGGYYNIRFKGREELSTSNLEDYLEEIIKKYVKPVETTSFHKENFKGDYVDRLVYSDVHIGMSVNGNGDPLYDGKWDREELLSRRDDMVTHVLEFQSSNTLRIDDLGDFLDGLKGETTRKGHKLPQNMNDKEVFDLGVQFKVELVDALVNNYDEIICTNLCEDNHAGVFSYFVNQAVKGILEQKYPSKVKVINQKKFIDHYKVGKHTFILCHGKDSESLKFGFKPHLDEKQEKKIDHYCKENRLYDGNYLEFSKGDSHLALYDDSTSKDFAYYNYPAFSPPSNWVKTCFSNTRSGFNFFNVNKEKNQKVSISYWF